jgi:protein phosphatase
VAVAKEHGASRPKPLDVGDTVGEDDATVVVLEVEKPTDEEQRYRVSLKGDPEGRPLWLRHRAKETVAEFEAKVECLARVHETRRVCLLPALVARFSRENDEFLLLDRLFAPSLEAQWSELTDKKELALCFEQMLLVVSKIHRAGYVLTDLQPSSFVRNEAGDLHLVELESLTRRGTAPKRVEASAYTAPELSEESGADDRSDIFSLGAILASAYHGKRYTTGFGPSELVDANPLLVPGITQLLNGSVTELANRFRSVDEMRMLLYQLKNEQARFPRPMTAISSTVGVSRHRHINEDSAGYQEVGVQYQSRPQHVGFYCVADGMGGHELGERASQLAVLGALQAFRHLTQEISFDQLWQAMPDIALRIGRAASEIVCTGAEQFPGDVHMGTTFTGVFIINDELSVAHVGDSRGVLYRKGSLKPLTLDHSLVASLVRVGQMTEEEAAVSGERNVLVRCIDGRMVIDERGFDSLAAIEIDSERISLEVGDVVILMSDGVWGVLPDPKLLALVAQGGGPQATADRIVRGALEAGSDDNATALVLCWE